jgi:hypothetical protein
MKHIFRVQYYNRGYYNRGEWKKTYFGSQYEGGLFHHVTLEDAKDDIKKMHEHQISRKKKPVKYRIVELIYDEIFHENF